MDQRSKIRNKGLLYPELSYEIVSVMLEVGRVLGSGHPEKIYQKAIAEELRRRGINFREQVPVKIVYKDLPIGIFYADFVIEEKIVLEIKTDRFFTRKNIDQTIGYLKGLKLQLGILGNFTRNGLEYKRLVNII